MEENKKKANGEYGPETQQSADTRLVKNARDNNRPNNGRLHTQTSELRSPLLASAHHPLEAGFSSIVRHEARDRQRGRCTLVRARAAEDAGLAIGTCVLFGRRVSV